MSNINHTLIADFPVFESFSTQELNLVLNNAKSLRYPIGEIIFEQSAPAHSYFFLLHGHIRVTKITPEGKQIGVRYINPGEFFGITEAIGIDRYPATATAAIDSIILCWPSSNWHPLMKDVPKLADKMLKILGRKLQQTHTRIIELTTQSSEQRIANVLLDLSQNSGRQVGENTEITFPISRQDIAEMTGNTLHTVSRILSNWESRSIVKSGRKRISITNLEALKALAQKNT
ncbi:Crp/Fnr family transcriptional regulator [Microvirga sp. W0021]|uniref:Crp/Fnr family transcriptional regulator n=1 Tax=Hohaiivirga grylli TaxID=3133970 RepID=A0ABV0BHR2_9HYPH